MAHMEVCFNGVSTKPCKSFMCNGTNSDGVGKCQLDITASDFSLTESDKVQDLVGTVSVEKISDIHQSWSTTTWTQVGSQTDTSAKLASGCSLYRSISEATAAACFSMARLQQMQVLSG